VIVANKRWQDLSTGQRRGIVLSSVVQFALLSAALVDIWRRPEEKIRGSKRLWALVAFVNFVGPIAYFSFGRKR
jgi:Phospholipase_D-nuclease N-terminal